MLKLGPAHLLFVLLIALAVFVLVLEEEPPEETPDPLPVGTMVEGRGASGSGFIPDQDLVNALQKTECETDTAGIIWCVAERDNQGSMVIGIYNSSDNGVTWVEQRFISGTSVDLFNPDLAIDLYNDTLYVVYEISTGSDRDIGLAQCPANGGTCVFQAIGPTNSGQDERWPVISADFTRGVNNNIYVAWQYLASSDNRDIIFSYTSGDGTWCSDSSTCGAPPQVRVLQGASDANVRRHLDMTNGPGQHLYLAYRFSADAGGAGDIYVESSVNDGDSWTTSAAISNPSGSNDASTPSIVATHSSTNYVMVSYSYQYSTFPSDWDVHMISSANGGSTWTTTPRTLGATSRIEALSRCTPDGMGSISGTVNGRVHCMYYDAGDLRYTSVAYNQMDSATWLTPVISNDVSASSSYRASPTTWQDSSGNWHPMSAYTSSSGLGKVITAGAQYLIQSNVSATFIVDGSSYSSATLFNWSQGSQHTVDANSPQVISPGVRRVFDSWSDGLGASHSVTVGTSWETLTVNYRSEFELITVDNGHGSINPAGSSWWTSGTQVTVTLSGSPDVQGTSRFVFDLWSDCDTSGSTQIQVLVTAPMTCTANWLTQYELITNDNGYGTITPGGSSWHDAGTQVQVSLSGNPDVRGDSRYLFVGWTDCSVQGSETIMVTMDGPKTCDANWQEQHLLTVENGGYGSVDPPVATWYDNGTVASVSLSGSPDVAGSTRHVFVAWTDCSTESVPNIVVTMDGPRTCTATWRTQYEIIVTDGGHGTTTPAGSGWFDEGTMATVSISGSPELSGDRRYAFDGWSDCSTDNATSIQILVDAPYTCSATWKIQFQLVIDNGGYGSVTPASGTWYDAGSQVIITITPDGPQAGARAQFVDWADCSTSTSTSITITMTAQNTCISNWQVQFLVSLDSGGHGGTDPANEVWVNDGDEVTITITGSPEIVGASTFVFTTWSDCSSSGSPVIVLVVTSPQTCVASWDEGFALTGFVLDENGAPLIGATVTILDGPVTTTDPTGAYEFFLGAGSYTVVAEIVGYDAASEEVTIDSAATLDFTLNQQGTSPPPGGDGEGDTESTPAQTSALIENPWLWLGIGVSLALWVVVALMLRKGKLAFYCEYCGKDIQDLEAYYTCHACSVPYHHDGTGECLPDFCLNCDSDQIFPADESYTEFAARQYSG